MLEKVRGIGWLLIVALALVCSEIRAAERDIARLKGYQKVPTKILVLVTNNSPCALDQKNIEASIEKRLKRQDIPLSSQDFRALLIFEVLALENIINFGKTDAKTVGCVAYFNLSLNENAVSNVSQRNGRLILWDQGQLIMSGKESFEQSFTESTMKSLDDFLHDLMEANSSRPK